MKKLCLLFVLALVAGTSGAVFAQEATSSQFQLTQRDNSGISGTGTIVDNGDGTSTITIRMTGYPEGSVLPEHIHEGVCSGTVPSVRFPLNDVVNGRSETTVDATLEQLGSEPLYVNVHESAQNLGRVVACGQLEAVKNMPSAGAGGGAAGKPGLWLAGLALVAFSLAAKRRSRRA